MIKLSVIVPTKDRYKYLKFIIDFAKKTKRSDIEFIINDNTEDNHEIVEYIGFSKNTKYFHIKDQLTVSQNFTNAILSSSGKYVTIIGDDDIVTEELFNILELIENQGITSAIFNKAIYKWDDVVYKRHKFQFLNIRTPQLTVPHFRGKISIINPMQELVKTIKSGAKGLFKMPNVYHGIVERRLLDDIYKITGSYFPGPSPDMANAVALSIISTKHAFIDIPLVITGHGYKSAGGSNQRREHIGNLKEKKFLPDNITESWNKNIPMIWSGPTIYAISLYESLDKMGKKELWDRFNYEKNYANLIMMHPEQNKLVKNTIINSKKSMFLYNIECNKRFIFKIYRYVYLYLTKNLRLTKIKYISKVKDSLIASTLVNDIVKEKMGGKNNV